MIKADFLREYFEQVEAVTVCLVYRELSPTEIEDLRNSNYNIADLLHFITKNDLPHINIAA